MNRTRDHYIEILYLNIRRIKDMLLPFLTLFILSVGSDSNMVIYARISVVIIGILIVLYSIAYWRNKVFEFHPGYIRYKQGVFKKYKQDIPYERIKSTNTTDSLLKRLFGLSNLNVELIGGEKISFVLSNDEIKVVENSLFGSKVQSNVEEKPRVNKFTLKEYSLIASGNKYIFLSALTITLSVVSVVLSNYVKLFASEKQEELDKGFFQTTMNETETIGVEGVILDFFVTGLQGTALCIALSIPVMIFAAYITYRNFWYSSSEVEYKVKYGTLNKSSYTLPQREIRSLYIREPIFYRIFGYVQVKVHSIGLNRSANNKLFVMPLLKKNKLDSFIKENFPEFEIPNENLHKPEKRVMPVYVGFYLLKLTIILGVGMLFAPSMYVGFIVIPVALYLGYCKWVFSGLYYNDRFIQVSYSEVFTKVTAITHKKYVESTECESGILSRRKNRAHYKVDVYTEAKEDSFVCKNLSSQYINEFLEYPLKK